MRGIFRLGVRKSGRVKDWFSMAIAVALKMI